MSTPSKGGSDARTQKRVMLRANNVQRAILDAAFTESPGDISRRLTELSELTGLPSKWIYSWITRQRQRARAKLANTAKSNVPRTFSATDKEKTTCSQNPNEVHIESAETVAGEQCPTQNVDFGDEVTIPTLGGRPESQAHTASPTLPPRSASPETQESTATVLCPNSIVCNVIHQPLPRRPSTWQILTFPEEAVQGLCSSSSLSHAGAPPSNAGNTPTPSENEKKWNEPMSVTVSTLPEYLQPTHPCPLQHIGTFADPLGYLPGPLTTASCDALPSPPLLRDILRAPLEVASVPPMTASQSLWKFQSTRDMQPSTPAAADAGTGRPVPVSRPQTYLSVALSQYAMTYNTHHLSDEDCFGAALALSHLTRLGMKWG